MFCYVMEFWKLSQHSFSSEIQCIPTDHLFRSNSFVFLSEESKPCVVKENKSLQKRELLKYHESSPILVEENLSTEIALQLPECSSSAFYLQAYILLVVMKACVDKRLKLFIEIWFSNSDWQNLTIALFLHSLTARSFFIENENSIRFFFLLCYSQFVDMNR